MRRPKGVMTMRELARCAEVSEDTVANLVKLLLVMQEGYSPYSMRKPHRQEVLPLVRK